MNQDFNLRLVFFVGMVLLISVLISGCGGLGPEEIDLENYPELMKLEEAREERASATANPDDFATAAVNVCWGIKTFADSEGWDLPEDTEDICKDGLTTYYDNYRVWPAATGNPAPAYVVANDLSIDLGIDSESYRGANFAQTFQGLLNVQREIYWP